VVHWFSRDLPAMFGKESSSGITRDDRSLPSIPTVKEWDSGGGSRGVKHNFTNNLRKADALREKIGLHLVGEAKDVARQMLDNSVRFVQELSVWISRHYQEVLNRSLTSDAKCWSLISHCIRTVFTVLGTARSAGSGQHPKGPKATAILCGTLQAHRVMRDMLSDGFAAYRRWGCDRHPIR
jgi:hypothetical protein